MRQMRHLWPLLVLLALFVAPASASAQQAAGYAGSAACAECHKQSADLYRKTTMGQVMSHPRTEHEKLDCESCHGPAKQHAESGGDERGSLIYFSKKTKTSVADRNAACLTCHEKTARTMWKGSTHESRNVACTDCHTVMHNESESASLKKQSVLDTCGRCHAQKKAQMVRNSHMPLAEGQSKMECTSCHNPHGSANEKMLIATSVNETCFSCHAEKRGPNLWEHAPVIENCANCHDSHGSTHEKMLKITRPRLCQQCHPTAHGGTTARPSDAASSRLIFNKACGNCHFNIHGSNHPAGAFFTR